MFTTLAKQRTVLNPGRVASRENMPDKSQHITELPAFKAWFGQSKAVTHSGTPQRMYARD